jgi:hypothetical protein
VTVGSHERTLLVNDARRLVVGMDAAALDGEHLRAAVEQRFEHGSPAGAKDDARTA